jgi:hypothetical protein
MIVSLTGDGDSDSNLDNCNAVQRLNLLQKLFDQEVSSRNMGNVLTRGDTELYQLYLEQLKMNK